MAEDAIPTKMAEPATSTVTTESLDDIISEYSQQQRVNEAVMEHRQSQASPQRVTQPVNLPDNVDPLDEGQFKQAWATVKTGQSVLNDQLEEMRSELTELRQERAQAKVETDINKAVEVVGEGLDLDKDFVRVHLELTAQKSPGFKALWENRHLDPKNYKRALKAINHELNDKYKVRQDSNLTETQVAIQKSQQSLAGKNVTNQPDDPIASELGAAKNQAEFDQIWRKYTQSG